VLLALTLLTHLTFAQLAASAPPARLLPSQTGSSAPVWELPVAVPLAVGGGLLLLAAVIIPVGGFLGGRSGLVYLTSAALVGVVLGPPLLACVVVAVVFAIKNHGRAHPALATALRAASEGLLVRF
jgi:hypothetical protein